MSFTSEYIESPRAGRDGLELRNLDSEGGPELLELWLSPDPQSLTVGRRATLRICAEVGVSEIQCERLELALGEALANAVLHGPGTAHCSLDDTEVAISAWPYNNNLIVEVCNQGPGVELPLPPYEMPPPGEGMTHGRGLPLMEALTDAMILCKRDSREGGASVFLIKRIDEPPDSGAARREGLR